MNFAAHRFLKALAEVLRVGKLAEQPPPRLAREAHPSQPEHHEA